MTRLYEAWEKEWTTGQHCRQTKYWFPKLNRRLSQQLLMLNRNTYSIGKIHGLREFRKIAQILTTKKIGRKTNGCF